MTLRPTSFKKSIRHLRKSVLLMSMAATLLTGGCATERFAERSPAWAERLQKAQPTAESVQALRPSPAEAQRNGRPTAVDPSFYKPGNDVLIRPPATVAAGRAEPDGDVKLNFQNANLLEVVKVILGDMLEANYTVDPAVQGSVTMQTTRALRQDDLVPTLELLLRMNGAALVTADNFYRVVPLANALVETRAPQLGDSKLALPKGYGVRLVPLQYVAAEEMSQILTPFVSGTNQILRVDSSRNLLILAGTSSDMDRLLETVDVFDVDRMAGMSVALFTPDFVDAPTLASDLEQLLADPTHGLMAGMVRFIVVERLNGLMVVTPRAEYLSQVREWIGRLDRNTGDAGPRLFIYRVQNGEAVELAKTLGDLFDYDKSESREASLAPGLRPATIGPRPDDTPRGPNSPSDSAQPEPPSSTVTTIRQPESFGQAQSDGLEISRGKRIQIIADEPNNALLILARGSEYRQILAALKQLDVSPMQVLIEVTIAEVTLSDNLSYGVEWFFKNAFGSKTGVATLDLGTAAGLNAAQPGFSYALFGEDDVVRGVLNLLATESNLSVISSPSLLVLNNQEATIQVGDEVPVSTQQQQSTATDANIINSIEYRNTGILLKVKPRINSGGLVIMEVEQEASLVPSTNNTDPLTPRIQQRKISSTVAVNSGNTIILGGLIQDNRDQSESGIPGFHKLPFVGALFGTKADNQDRTELIVLITPRAVSNNTAALQVTEEFRQRLQRLIPRTKAVEATAVPAVEPET